MDTKKVNAVGKINLTYASTVVKRAIRRRNAKTNRFVQHVTRTDTGRTRQNVQNLGDYYVEQVGRIPRIASIRKQQG